VFANVFQNSPNAKIFHLFICVFVFNNENSFLMFNIFPCYTILSSSLHFVRGICACASAYIGINKVVV
jgi:hypothetical protein